MHKRKQRRTILTSPFPPLSHSPIQPLTWIELNRVAIAHNLAEIRRLSDNRPVLAMVKGNAYGHGAALLCPELQRLGVNWFGVSRIREALELRAAGIHTKVINMGFFSAGEEQAIIENKIVSVIFRYDDAKHLARVAKRLRSNARVHLKIDTGLGRLGVRHDEAVSFAKRVAKLDGLKIEGICTALTEEPDFDLEQVRRLESIISQMGSASVSLANLLRHAASSAAICEPNNEPLLLDMVRAGVMLHGLYPNKKSREARRADLRPVLSLKTRVALLKKLRKGESVGYHRQFIAPRKMTVAILPFGYSDGIDPRITNGGAVLIRGRRYPLVSSMTINLCGARDTTDIREGDEVVLIGKQGKEQITADEMGAWIGESNYKVVMRLSPYLDRVLV